MKELDEKMADGTLEAYQADLVQKKQDTKSGIFLAQAYKSEQDDLVQKAKREQIELVARYNDQKNDVSPNSDEAEGFAKEFAEEQE